MIKILFIGDIIGKSGRRAIKHFLPKLKKKLKPDLIIANAENLAHGKGATIKTIEEMREAGVDFFTSGNHIWKQKEIISAFKNKSFPLLRPANYGKNVPGKGYSIVKDKKGRKILIINLIGRVFFSEHFDSPFIEALNILKKFKKEDLKAVIVDFHAEATSEKSAMKHFLDGKVSAVIGTHTHIPTADSEITSKGTAYITDVGMVGPKDSVIGVDKEIILKWFLTHLPVSHEIPEGKCVFNSVYIEIGEKGKAKKIKLIQECE